MEHNYNIDRKTIALVLALIIATLVALIALMSKMKKKIKPCGILIEVMNDKIKGEKTEANKILNP